MKINVVRKCSVGLDSNQSSRTSMRRYWRAIISYSTVRDPFDLFNTHWTDWACSKIESEPLDEAADSQRFWCKKEKQIASPVTDWSESRCQSQTFNCKLTLNVRHSNSTFICRRSSLRESPLEFRYGFFASRISRFRINGKSFQIVSLGGSRSIKSNIGVD